MRRRAGHGGRGRRSFNEAAGADPADARLRPRRRSRRSRSGFNEAAGADPADATHPAPTSPIPPVASMRPRGQTPRMRRSTTWRPRSACRFNEAAGADPADAARECRRAAAPAAPPGFNEAAGADPADARRGGLRGHHRRTAGASMRPRGQTPRMPSSRSATHDTHHRFNEAAGADPADAMTPFFVKVENEYRFNEAAGADPADANCSAGTWA